MIDRTDLKTRLQRMHDLDTVLDQCDVFDAEPTLPITQEFVQRSRGLILQAVRADAESQLAKLTGGAGPAWPAWLSLRKPVGWVKGVVKSKELRGGLLTLLVAGAIVWGRGCLPGPGPDPTPTPIPTPVDPPKPPAPIPAAGFRVLIVTETAELSKLPASQVAILTAKPIKDYLDLRCVDENGVKGWRMWDADVSTANVSKTWQDAFARPRASLPWIVISNGISGYEGPLPKTVAETLELLKKFGGV